MQQLIFSTHNRHKAVEIQSLLPANIRVLTLEDVSFHEDIPETAPTLEGNALLKTQAIVSRIGLNCFSDDTGLEIEALNGEPGVFSARYAGEAKDSEANMALVLGKLEGKTNRNAQFRTAISLYWNGHFHRFEGVVKGIIRTEKSGTSGFGYDPIFEPENCGKTFAEMDVTEKNTMSHRARAVEKMIAFLKEENS